MAAETLQSELLAVPGVASAEVDIAEGALPAGVKVSLSPDADARRVGVEVQRVLAAHGMRSRFSSGGDADSEVLPEVPPIPQLPDDVEPSPVMPPPPIDASTAPSIEPVPPPPLVAPPEQIAVSAVLSVSVEERSDGRTASVVLTDGRRASRAIGFDSDELDTAIIAATAEAVGVSVTRAAVEWLEVDDGNVVTVVIRRADDSLGAGAGVVRSGRAFAVGIATRSALEA